MNRERNLLLSSFVLLAAAAAACGDQGATSPSATASASAPATKASVTVKATASASASAASSASAPAPAGDDATPKLPPIEIGTPAPQKIGDKTVVGEVCKMNGPVMKDESFANGIGQIALGSDGAIYVLDNDHKVRKYLAKAGGPCELTLDASFGDKGILAVGKPEDKPDTLVSDGAGDLYVSGWSLKPTKISGGKIAGEVCDQTGKLHVDASGKAGTMDKKKVKLEDGGKCPGEDIKVSGSWDTKINMSDILPFGDGLAVIGNEGAATKIGLAGADGKVKATIGDKDGDKEICSLAGLVPCNMGVCVMDANCRGLRVWDKDGKWVGAGKLGEMAGLSYPWPVGFVMGKDVAYMSMTHGPKDDKDKNSYGFVVKVTGLN